MNSLLTASSYFVNYTHQDATKKQLSEKPLNFKGFLLFSEQK